MQCGREAWADGNTGWDLAIQLLWAQSFNALIDFSIFLFIWLSRLSVIGRVGLLLVSLYNRRIDMLAWQLDVSE